jgi:hypothetical protein
MSYILNGTTVRSPSTFKESNSTLVAQQRVLSGGVARDYFGTNKRIWVCEYNNVNGTDFAIIKALLYDLPD